MVITLPLIFITLMVYYTTPYGIAQKALCPSEKEAFQSVSQLVCESLSESVSVSGCCLLQSGHSCCSVDMVSNVAIIFLLLVDYYYVHSLKLCQNISFTNESKCYIVKHDIIFNNNISKWNENYSIRNQNACDETFGV